jgi:sulfite exporter TauE/SafE
MKHGCYEMETKKYTQKFRVMGIFLGILGVVVMASGITSARYCSAGLAIIILGVYLFIDDWDKALAD